MQSSQGRSRCSPNRMGSLPAGPFSLRRERRTAARSSETWSRWLPLWSGSARIRVLRSVLIKTDRPDSEKPCEALGVPQDLRQPTDHSGEIRLPVLRETSTNSSRKAMPFLSERLASRRTFVIPFRNFISCKCDFAGMLVNIHWQITEG
jgi:hypothetical protein